MSKKMLKLTTMLLTVAMIVSLAAGCGKESKEKIDAGSTASGTTTEATKELEKVELRAYLPGDAPIGLDEVLAEVEKASEKDVNVKLKFTFIPWGDLANKTQVQLSAGDNSEIYFDAPWCHLGQMVAANAYDAWDDKLDTYPNVKNAFSQAQYDSNRYNGKIYGLPLGVYSGDPKGVFAIRKDLRVKYGLPEIKTREELVAYLEKVKENDKGIIPLTTNGKTDAVLFDWFSKSQNERQYEGTFAPAGCLAYVYDNTPKVVNFIEDAAWFEDVKFMRKLYTDGLLDRNVMNNTDEQGMFKTGKAACIRIGIGGGLDIPGTLAKNMPGAEAEYVGIFQNKEKKVVSNMKQWNFACINTHGKNKDRAFMFFNWIYADQANYDLITYGIKGKHWEPVGDKSYKAPEGADASKNYVFPAYALVWSPKFDRVSASMPESYLKWDSWAKDTNNFELSVLSEFVFDNAVVKSEIAKISQQYTAYQKPMQLGVVDPEQYMLKLKDAYKVAGFDKYLAEMQKQIDEFLAKKK